MCSVIKRSRFDYQKHLIARSKFNELKLGERVFFSSSSFVAQQLKVNDDRLTVTGDKGYCSIRSNYGRSF